MSEQFLYQKLDVLKELNNLKNLPEIIEKGLSENISLREYQKDAFQYFVTYFENKELRKNNQSTIEGCYSSRKGHGAGRCVLLPNLRGVAGFIRASSTCELENLASEDGFIL